MVEAFKKLIFRLLPEVASGYHLPRYARVVAVSDPACAGATSTEYRPYLAVDIAVLDDQGRVDPALPVVRQVPVPVAAVGGEAGHFGVPHEGALVVLAFIGGLPSQPYIQAVMPQGATLPGVDYGDQLQAQSAACYQRITASGDIDRETDGTITDRSTRRVVDSVVTVETHQRRTTAVAEHDVEEIIGKKTVEALGAIALLSGGRCDISAVDNVNVTAAGDINETVGRIKNSVAKARQRLKVAPGGTIWIGDDTVNVLDLLSQTLAALQDVATTAASHTHPDVGPPTQAATFADQASTAGGIKSSLDPITE